MKRAKTLITLSVFIFALGLFAHGTEEEQENAQELKKYLFRGRAQYSVGDYLAAKDSLTQALEIDPENETAKKYLKRVEDAINPADKDYIETRAGMIQEVDISWERPKAIPIATAEIEIIERNPLLEKMSQIIIPKIVFQNAPLSQVILSLSELSEKFDPADGLKGINIVLLNAIADDPKVTIHLRNLSLGKALDLITRSVHYQYDIEEDVITVQKAEGPIIHLNTDFLPISRATVIKLIGKKSSSKASEISQLEEEQGLKNFFGRAGVPFEQASGGPEGAVFAFDGTQIIATNTLRNLEKMRNILVRYKQTKQVEIEAKFLEVQQGALEELGFKWRIHQNNYANERFARTYLGDSNNLRSLSNAFATSSSSGTGQILIDGRSEPHIIRNAPPTFPNSVNLGTNTTLAAGLLGIIEDWQVRLLINALEQHTGSDLMSAPKVTVLSGKTAKITVAQVLRYPQSYGDIQSDVGMAGLNAANTSAGVTITAGTPRDFVDKNVGVEMEVTPTVEDDNCNITLRLDPKVTEFEGFVEYGGKSVALAGARNMVEVPSGFFQPIFSTREIETEVTIHDGATVVMGGLTREEIKSIRDKVPILGDIPGVGRLFRSKGETNQKRNLLIFVTANMVSAGGGLENQQLRNVPQNAIFQDAKIVTPEGLNSRISGSAL